MGVIGNRKKSDDDELNDMIETDEEELQEYQEMSREEKDAIIKQSIREALTISDNIKPTNTLVLTLYQILTDFFVNDIKYVICELPTGSGKSVIGYMLHYCYRFCACKIWGSSFPPSSYFLTSSKMLQKQIEDDFGRFNILGDFEMLKGTANYECVFYKVQQAEGEKNLAKLGITAVDTKKEKVKAEEEKLMFDKRFCIGMSSTDRKNLPCEQECPYFVQRKKTSEAPCAVLNYAYFLNVLRGDFNPFFGIRHLTIADEAHLIPDIVCNLFSFEITRAQTSKLLKYVSSLKNEYFTVNPTTKMCPPLARKEEEEQNCRDCITEMIDDHLKWMMLFFNRKIRQVNDIVEYYNRLDKCVENLNFLITNGNESFVKLHKVNIGKIFESLDGLDLIIHDINELAKRPEDVYISSDIKYNHDYYTHLCKDMSETAMVKRNFVRKLDHALFMSATLGNTEEYAALLGLDQGTYTAYRLESTFDFSKSPIYLCDVGWLNFKNFETNIDKVLNACVNVCEKLHPNDCGIVHTSTFKVADILKEKIADCDGNLEMGRYLFYRTPEEKDECVRKMKTMKFVGRDGRERGYVVVGPSLYEGLDLKYDDGRFNILVKVPYPGIDDYVRAKMQRLPFWYSRVTLEKIVQAIGRTNRAVDDWSVTYLLDSSFDKQMYAIPGETIKSRLRYLKLSTESMERRHTARSTASKAQTDSYIAANNSSSNVPDWDDMDDLPF